MLWSCGSSVREWLLTLVLTLVLVVVTSFECQNLNIAPYANTGMCCGANVV